MAPQSMPTAPAIPTIPSIPTEDPDNTDRVESTTTSTRSSTTFTSLTSSTPFISSTPSPTSSGSSTGSPSPANASSPLSSPTDQASKGGLAVGTTVGIGMGVAVSFIITFTLAFVLIRRRRRNLDTRRKASIVKSVDGEWPEEEIARKVALNLEKGDAAEADGKPALRLELSSGEDGKVVVKRKMMESPASELGTGGNSHELSAQEQAAELGGGGFVAELDGNAIARQAVTTAGSTRDTRGNDDELHLPTTAPAPTATNAGDRPEGRRE